MTQQQNHVLQHNLIHFLKIVILKSLTKQGLPIFHPEKLCTNQKNHFEKVHHVLQMIMMTLQMIMVTLQVIVMTLVIIKQLHS